MITHSHPASAEIEKAFHETEEFWQTALELEFGADACQARYEPRGKGAEGTPLRAAAEMREAARSAWSAAFGLGG